MSSNIHSKGGRKWYVLGVNDQSLTTQLNEVYPFLLQKRIIVEKYEESSDEFKWLPEGKSKIHKTQSGRAWIEAK